MKRVLALISVMAAVAGLVIGLPATPAGAAAPTVGSASFGEAPDYRSDKWANPWDFSDGSDGISNQGWFTLNANASVSNGQLNVTSTGNGGWFELLQTRSYPPAADDAYARPLQPTTYSRMSFRMWAQTSGLAMLEWHDCFAAVNCDNRRSFTVEAGWHTYDLDPMSLGECCGSSGNHLWNRAVGGIRIGIAGGNTYHLDWFRVYKPIGNISVNVGSSSVDSVWWDLDNNQGNNSGSATADQFAGTVGANGSATFPASAFPPGTYRFYTVKGGVKSAYSAPVTIAPKPRPVVIDPDVAGGDDWATVVRGDAWDFSQGSDLAGWENMGPGNPPPSMNAGILSADSTGSAAPGDPNIVMAVPTPIDATTYHRLSVRYVLRGPFDLGVGPGGGAMARFLWRDAESGGLYHDSQDFVEITDQWHTYTTDLFTNPRSDIEDETSSNRRGFGVSGREWVNAFRWDPHEDAGGRYFAVDSIQLARNDRGKPNFGVKFEDEAWVPGTTADIYLDTDNVGADGTKIASNVAVSQGVNTYNLRTSVLANGTRYVYIVMKSPAGTQTTAYSTGPVDMGTWTGFTDVPSTHAFRPQIDWLTQELIADGYPDNSFRPTWSVSRQAAASFLWKYSGSPAATGSSFPDVPADHPFYDPIRWMVAQGIASGFSDGNFHPTDIVSRQALASFLYKLAGSPPVTGSAGFADVPDDHPFVTAITWAAQNGVVSGYSDGTFRPGAAVSRQAMAAMLAKFDALP